MRHTVTVSRTGKVRIPGDLLASLGIGPGDRVEIGQEGDRLALSKRSLLSLHELRGAAAETNTQGTTRPANTEET